MLRGSDRVAVGVEAHHGAELERQNPHLLRAVLALLASDNMVNMPLPDEILAESSALFHDTRVQDIDPKSHAAFVIARVLDRGTLASVGALLRYYGRERIRDFLREGGTQRVSRRTVPLWAAFLQIAPDECTLRSSPHRSSPFWTV